MTRGLVLLALLASSGVSAQTTSSFEGDWVAYDDGRAEAVVRLRVVGDRVEGRIVRLLPPPGEAGHLCSGCVGPYAGRDVRQLRLVEGLRLYRGTLRGGRLTDFEDGSVYDCRMSLDDRGQLRVQIYRGLPALGVTDVWTRAPR